MSKTQLFEDPSPRNLSRIRSIVVVCRDFVHAAPYRQPLAVSGAESATITSRRIIAFEPMGSRSLDVTAGTISSTPRHYPSPFFIPTSVYDIAKDHDCLRHATSSRVHLPHQKLQPALLHGCLAALFCPALLILPFCPGLL